MMFVDGNGVLHNLLVAVYTDMNEEEHGLVVGQALIAVGYHWSY